MEFEELVGFHDHVNAMIQKLTSMHIIIRQVISIGGMAGQGKTALARKVYNDHSIVNHFDVRVWCSVSKIYNRRKLLLDILKQIKGDKLDTVDDDDSIADMLHKSLMGRRYLIVLDDIWEVRAWDDLKFSFPNHSNGNRIMVTTRDLDVVKYVSHVRYLLPLLKDEESWELLQKNVFQGESCPLELLSVGPLVAKECKGLPSLVITIAGILSTKKEDPSFWLEVAYDISSHALEEESMKMTESSYDHLEDHLKPCLLYMSLFPKGYEIPVSDLLKWWIAEEFVHNTDILDLEKESRRWLYDLVSRNLVMVSKRRASGEMKCGIILDQVREFCLRKIKEEKFMQSIVPYNRCRPVDSDEHRLCVYIHDTMKTNYKERESFEQRQRPLEFIAHPKFGISGRKNLFPLLNNLRLIRVLHLLDIYLDNSWATAFQSLTELRFLAIFVKAFDFKWVSHLLHLQTLRVRSSYIRVSLPAIWKMEKLRHVDISEFSITMEENEGVNFEESSDIVLHNMKTFGMCYMSLADMTPKFWGKFPNLEELRLNIEDAPNNSGSTLMCSDMFPSSLKVLCLSDIFLTEEIVSNIARLEHLETLKLSEIYFTGEKHWDLSDRKFKRLRALKLHHVFMTRWIFSDKSFPQLETLVIKSCSKLEEIPYSLRYSETLELIKVVDCSDSVGNSALKIKNERKWPEVDISNSKKN